MAKSRHVLIVDDEEAICWGLRRLLTEEGHDVSVASCAEDGLTAAKTRRPDLVVLDVRLPGMDGLTAMQHLRPLIGTAPIVVITAFGNLETAVQALKNGAFDYLTKPFDLEQAAAVFRRALAHVEVVPPTVTTVPAVGRSDLLLGSSPGMQRVFKQIAIVAPSDVSVLILGESGTGKELVARAIHRHSQRADQPFLTVNLASLSPTLIESELFGHAKGAFTGADTSRRGLLELADGGTVFLDEIGDVPLEVQVKLLRVLEQQEVTPVGENRSRPTNFRIIAATNRDVQAGIRAGTFRQDFYFRLAGFEIALPPLRERDDDIVILAEHFLAQAKSGTAPAGFTNAAISELKRRHWPGNVRELRSAVQQAGLLARGQPIAPEHLPQPRELLAPAADDAETALQQATREWAIAEFAGAAPRENLYQRILQQIEPALFEEVLKITGGNRAAAADILGLHRATLRKKLR